MFVPGTVCAEAELRLIRELMQRYDPDVRPSENVSTPVDVTMDLTLHQIIELVMLVLSNVGQYKYTDMWCLMG